MVAASLHRVCPPYLVVPVAHEGEGGVAKRSAELDIVLLEIKRKGGESVSVMWVCTGKVYVCRLLRFKPPAPPQPRP